MVFLVRDKSNNETEIYSTNSGEDNAEFKIQQDLVTIRIKCMEISFDMQVAYEEWMKQYEKRKEA